VNPLRILTQLHGLLLRIRDLELESLTVTVPRQAGEDTEA